MTRDKRLATSLALLAILACAPAPPRPNVLLIVIDTLRADRLGNGGFPRGATPHLDALARTGVSYSRAYASSNWTLASIGSILTGLYPSVLHATQFRSRIPSAATTLAERLRAKGWRTAAVVSHDLCGAGAGFDQGFDSFDETEARGTSHLSSPGVTDRGQALLRELAGDRRPFFLFLHYFDPHYKYVRHPEYGWSRVAAGRLTGDERFRDVSFMSPRITEEEIRFLVDRYDEEVRFTDAAIGRVLRTLAELGRDDDTLVLVTSDHGEEFWEHDRFGHGNSMSLHEEVVRVPLIARDPKDSRRSGVVAEPVSLVSVTPTILDRVGLETGEPFQEPPLAGLSSRSAADAAPPLLSEYVFERRQKGEIVGRDTVRTLIGPRYKLVRGGGRGDLPEVYDLVTDPAERHDLGAAEPELASDLQRTLEARLAQIRSSVVLEPELTEMTREQSERLKALGYVGD